MTQQLDLPNWMDLKKNIQESESDPHNGPQNKARLDQVFQL